MQRHCTRISVLAVYLTTGTDRMASLRPAFRAAPRAHLLRPSRITPLSFRTAATVNTRRPATDAKPAAEAEEAQEDISLDNTDPNMNGNYPDPSLTSALPIKRQFRDPYADWWDPIERRNYGETVHEDNDILGIFSTEQYTHFSAGWGGVLMVCDAVTGRGWRHALALMADLSSGLLCWFSRCFDGGRI